MFSRAKRFDYYPRPEVSTPPCHRFAKKHAMSTPKTNPKKTPDMTQLLEQLEQTGKRIQDRCDTIDELCRDYLSLDEGFFSTRSSSPEELALTPTFEEDMLVSESLVQFCAETVADLVCKKLEQRNSEKSVWKKMRKSGETVWNFFCPKIIDGQLQTTV
ncbi:hypothetical protein TcasGA2_TC007675 [Tribolium castaneum]|uniref:Uncharacterized protein n=1 Tax=Tribolium castaneum TaxID=7070 RepID=D2A2B5_TRICA|nr:PREDICTED: uncharacterized protein LOC103312556 [Tribolium castaneum]EFA02047.1 hypothetical protein TcasGA2_TC007675 [Tribolium castaneum]|eukprot:XP_008191707.1 PREDICTED: uncharacterized protein LOC103312556 [Tribolium castaneum]